MRIIVTSDLHYRERTTFFDKFFEDIYCENPDVLVIAGDLISNRQKQMERLFKVMREWFINTPILIVLGNHCFWQDVPRGHIRFHGRLTYGAMRIAQRELFSKYNIHYLQDNLYTKENVVFFGFDGYYNEIPPETNDSLYMPKYARDVPIHTYLNWRASKKLDKILLDVDEYANHTKICVTHFPPYSKDPTYANLCANPSFLDFITEKFDYFIVGHSHQQENWEQNGCRIINPGSDYEEPRYVLFETN